MKKLLFLWVLVLTTFSLKAQSKVLIGDLYYNLYDDNTAEVTEPTSGEYDNLNNLIIPASVEHRGVSYAVTSIGSWALSNCYALTSITIPNSVTTIGDYAFCVCDNLKSITIPNSVTSIGDNAFSNCSSLTSITILNAVTSIGNSAFANCRLLTSITIPNSVTSIGGRAFSYCDALTSVTIGENVTSIGHSAFASCDALNSIVVAEGNPNYDSRGNCNAIIETATNTLISGCKSTIIPNSVTSIGDSAFYDCSSLTSITIPESVTSIGSHAFYDCSWLTSVAIGKNVTSIGSHAFYDCSSLTSITIPESVTSIGSHAFYNCYELTSVTIGENVTSIGSSAFRECSSLTSISIPESVTSIGSSAFEDCDALTSVTIGKNVTSIGIWAFDGCRSLTSVTIEANTPPTIGPYLFSSNPVCTIPCRTLTAYQASDWAQYVSEFIEEECEPIDPTWQILYTSTDGNIVTPNATDVFGANIVNNTYENGVGTITFDGPVTSIGERAFYYCDDLTSITIPNSVTSIGQYAFWACYSLTSITIPNSVTSIGSNAFYGCEFTSITIPNSVTSIGMQAFLSCSSSLTSMVVETGNTKYDSREDCNAIIETATNTLIAGCQNTVIPNTITSIGREAFYCCDALTSITIPNSVTSIGLHAFYFCSSLTSITIPNSVTSIGNSAFSRCNALTSMVVETGNTKFDSREGCNAIVETATNTLIAGCQKTVVPNSVTSIGDYAFQDCYSLTSITIPNSVTSIGRDAFYNCRSLTSITIPNSVTSIGDYAFVECYSLTSITIPNSVTSIGESAFEYCDITSVTIGSGVTSIGESAFEYCDNLTSITCEATTPPALGSNVFPSNLETVYIPCGTKEAYEASDWASYSITSFIEEECEATWQITYTSTDDEIVTPSKTDGFGANIVNNTYENGVGTITFDGPITSIGDNAFKEWASLTSITIPNSVTSIGESAFCGCSSLTTITIPNSVTSIGDAAFIRCSSLTSITIPNSVTSIVEGAFRYCDALTSIKVEAGNTKYDSRGNCNAIIETATNTLIAGCQNTVIPNTITSIGKYAFAGFPSLTSITIPESLTRIGEGAFYDCTNLKSVDIPSTVKSIEQGAFHNIGIESVYIPAETIVEDWKSSMVIWFGVFSSCQNLTNITFAEGIKRIPAGVIAGCPNIRSVHIPSSVTSIGIQAFVECSMLTSITCEATVPPALELYVFPSNLETVYIPCGTKEAYEVSDWKQYVAEFIEEGCEDPIDPTWQIFYTSTDGEIVTPGSATNVFGANIVSNTYENGQGVITFDGPVTSIGNQAFWIESALTSITIPNSVTSIGNDAFCACENLISITIPNSVTSIGARVFSGCNALTSVTIPNSVKSIGNDAFRLCSSLTSITIPESVTSLGDGVFNQCSSLTSITIPNNIKSIGDYMFFYCSSLTSITIPNSVTSIGKYAFSSCSSLTSITIPECVTSIGIQAFMNCKGLTTITIPKSVTSIGDDAFSRCTSLTSVTIEANTPPTIGTDLFSSNPICTIPCRTLTAYQASDWAQYVSEFIEEECEELIDPTWQIFYTSTDGEIVTPGSGTNVFGANIVSNTYENGQGVITFDGPVTSIGNQAFWIESALTSITIPNSVTSIGNDAFCACENLISITIPNSVTSIGARVFSGCNALTSVTIPNSVKSIGNDAFRLCSSLTSITIPESVTSIGKSVFNQCSSLTSITIPNTVKSIGDSMFYGCTSLTSITIPNSVTSIGNYAFSSCTSLTSITIPNSVTSIEIQAFTNCKGLTTITIPNSVTSIGDLAFKNCKGLTTITIPNSVTSIGDDAFSNCDALTSVTIEANTPPTIGTDLFSSNPICTIPCGTLTAYQASDWAQYVSEFVEECEEPEQLNQPDKLYFHPSTVWKEAGARFAAHFLSTTNESWVNMSDADGDGIYEVENPKTYNQIRFCRIDPNATSENISNNVWQATNTLQIPNNENDNALNTCYAFYKNDWSLDGTWVVPTPLTANNCWTIINTYQDQTINIVVERQFFDIGEWYTLCLPFSCNASIFGEAHQFASLDVANDIVTIMTSLHNTIEAGAPYLFKPLSSYDHFIVENVKIPSFVTPQTISVSGGGFTISLTSVLQTEGTTDDAYWIGSGGYLYNNDVDKLGLRAYFNISKPAGMAPRFRVSTSEENATGFDILIDKENHTMKILENGQLVILRNGEKYNIQGQKL